MTFPTQPPAGDNQCLWSVLPPARLATFAAHAKGDLDRALDIYTWDRALSAAVFADIAVVEVALRDAVHKAATREWGAHWYESIPLDDRSSTQLAEAWRRLPKRTQDEARASDVPGRLVANCMFGFWTNLFDEGGFAGRQPRRKKVDYEANWKVLRNAFPGGSAEARAERQRISQELGTMVDKPGFSREWVHTTCKNVNDLRNRVAHHEPLINGFPLKGRQRRMTAAEGYAEYVKLARMIDAGLGHWLQHHSDVPNILGNKP